MLLEMKGVCTLNACLTFEMYIAAKRHANSTARAQRVNSCHMICTYSNVMEVICMNLPQKCVRTYWVGEINRNWRLILVLRLSITKVTFCHLFNELLHMMV